MKKLIVVALLLSSSFSATAAPPANLAALMAACAYYAQVKSFAFPENAAAIQSVDAFVKPVCDSPGDHLVDPSTRDWVAKNANDLRRLRDPN